MGKSESEAHFQARVVQHLQDRGLYFFSVPNEGAGVDPRRMAGLKAMGLRAGVSDLVVVLPGGRVLFLELKTPTGEQSEGQRRFQSRVEALGHIYAIARSLEDVDNVLLPCYTVKQGEKT